MEYIGAIPDNRSKKEKEKDYSIREIGYSSHENIPYLTKKEALKQVRTIRNQVSTSSCGAHAGELAASHTKKDKIFSRAKIYRRRRNYPNQGMYLFDIGDIMKKPGLAENDNITAKEEIYNAISPIFETIDSIANYTLDSNPTFEELAYTSNVLKLPQVVLVYAKDSKEYGKEIPVADEAFSDPYGGSIRHFVCIPPNGAFKVKNKKYLLIQDSAGFGNKFVRFFTEDWVKRRITDSMTVMGEFEFKKEKIGLKLSPFTQDFTIGDKSPEIERLQLILSFLGFFPQNVSTTGYYGGITRQAVKDFQKKYEKSILWAIGLKTPTGYFGPSTRKVLNKMILDGTL